MPEGQEGPPISVIKSQDRQHLQELSAGMILRREGVLPQLDRDRIEKARIHMDIGRWDAAISDMEETPEEVGGRLRKAISAFGVRRKDDGEKQRTGAERDRFKRASEAADTALSFLQEGYDALDGTKQGAIRRQIEQALGQHGTIGAEFVMLPGEQKKQLIEGMIKDPSFARQLRLQLTKTADNSLIAEDDIRRVQRELHEATTDRIHAESNLERAKIGAERAQERVDKAARGETSSAVATAIQKQMDTLGASIEGIDTEVKIKQERIEEILREYGDRGERATSPIVMSEYTQLNREIPQKLQEQRQLRERQTVLAQQLTQTIPDDQVLEDQLDSKHQKLEEAEAHAGGKQYTIAEKQAMERDLVAQRAEEEETMAASLEFAFMRAAQGKISEDLRLAMSALEREDPALRDEIKSKSQRDIRKAFESRWTQTVTRRSFLGRNRQEQVLNPQQANLDFSTMIQSGPEAMLEDILKTAKRQRFGRSRGGKIFTDAEVADILKDKTFAEEIKQDMIKQLVSQTMLSRKLNPGEVYQLVHSSWGSESIDTAIGANATFREELNRLAGEGEVNYTTPTFKERFKKEAGKNPLLLFSVLGTIPWLATAATRASWQTMTQDDRRHLSTQLSS